MKSILDVFDSYYEAWFCYSCFHWDDVKGYCEKYDFSETDVRRMLTARNLITGGTGTWKQIDCYYNILLKLDNMRNSYGEQAEWFVDDNKLATRQSWVYTHLKLHGWEFLYCDDGAYYFSLQ